jgi:putative methionine-R-sulfoxide reductase with GAF domain
MNKEEKKLFYKNTIEIIEGFLKNEKNIISNLANVSSLMYFDLNEKLNNKINWFGF